LHVSRKADYAVRAMAFLAAAPGKRVLIAEIAQAMAIPQAFLAKIMKQMVGAGLVLSQPGRGGGYQLALTPQQITFRAIVEAVEGPWTLVPCQAEDHDGCTMATNCSQVSVWNSIQTEMLAVLDDYTLDRLEAPAPIERQLISLQA
jgi:Rrf2 family iron-sulfur cluster assembly transcriptional regulator